jgi:hypothetical protein
MRPAAPTAGGPASVRPPGHARPMRGSAGDPLAGWDLGVDAEPEAAQPVTWAVVAGTAAAAALTGAIATSGASGPARRLGRAVRAGLVGAVVAVVALRPWERPPEDDAWALAHQRGEAS